MSLRTGDRIKVVTSAGPFPFLPQNLGEVVTVDRAWVQLKFLGHQVSWWEIRDGSLHFHNRHTIRVERV